MSTKFSIQNNAVNKQSSNLDAAAARFTEVSKRYTQSLEPLRPAWKGQAAVAFTEAETKVKEGVERYLVALRQLQEKMATSGKTYDAAHQEQTSTIKSQSQSLDLSKF